ncbi:circadian clock-controlled protein-like [Cimex lectularius]|uniref:Uncharacterized protein n=1 Tax=Cimex lectularius TaxID=79782 RepID=A0A8I6RI06_CIMLE|nr:circadian clock-controlled protein-like [Cimex lectularius]
MTLQKPTIFAGLLLLGVITVAVAKIPSYIHVCKRNDPNLNQCIVNSVQALLPKLKKGIPELDVPALEPLHLPEIVISRGGNFKAIGKNIIVRGASNFEIKNFKSDVNKVEYQVVLRFPELFFDGIYDVDAKLLTLPIKGRGPMKGSGTDIEGNAIIKGRKVSKGGKTYLKFDRLDLKLKMKNYSVRLENLFDGDKTLGEAINNVLNDNKKELMRMIRPKAEQVASSVLLEVANKITEHFEYDELFPAK